MNEQVKIQLFRMCASMPWAEVETTQHNIRIIYYDGSGADAPQKILVLNPKEAKDIAKAINTIVDNYCYKKKKK